MSTSEPRDLPTRLIELECQLTFMERKQCDLNDALLAQSARIDTLERAIARLASLLRASDEEDSD